MISKYKKISIVYGRGGKECALQIDQKLRYLHDKEGMPVESYLLAEQLLSSEDIVSRVKDIITSSMCIILLTFDYVDGTRVRQNVLIEIGMALMLIGRENCFVVCEKQSLPDDFPSDIRGVLNLNHMDIRDAEKTAEKVTEAIVKKLGLKSHSRILEDHSYTYDYMKVLADIPAEVFEEKPDIQMYHILDCWRENVNTFTYTEERICYILERVAFFPVFPGNDRMKQFLEQMKESIRTEVRDFSEEETEELIAGRAMVMRILEYVQLRQIQEKVFRGQMVRFEFERIADDLEDYIEKIRKNELQVNWYIQVVALDYAALARMQAMNVAPGTPDERIVGLRHVIEELEQVEDLIRTHCSRAGELWSGYVQYNLSRSYERLIRAMDEKGGLQSETPEELIQNRAQLMKKVRECSLKAISLRKRWIENGMKGVFSTALSLEYFLALKHEYELYDTLSGYSSERPEQIYEEIRGSLAELTIYCRTTGLEKLFAMREDFEELMRRFQ